MGEKQIAIVLGSSSVDRVRRALRLASAGSAMGIEVSILLTHEALRIFVKERPEDTRNEADAPSGTLLARDLASVGFRKIESQLADARRTGLKLYACTNSLRRMGILRRDIRKEVDEVVSLATFLAYARNAALTKFI